MSNVPDIKVLLLGYSDIARRRVLPALAACGLRRVDVATRSQGAAVKLPEPLSGHIYDDYAPALAGAGADLVWISTTNDLHAPLAMAALEAGGHVVIDKPATTSLADAEALLAMAARRGRMLAEATVWAFHPLAGAVRAAFAAADSAPQHLVASFSYPPLPPQNFRNSPHLGGGALADLGPYAVSAGRVFLGGEPAALMAHGPDSLEAFTVLADYGAGRSMAGSFAANTGYSNRLTLLGPRVALHLERQFSPPPEHVVQLVGLVDNQPVTIPAPAADSFACFIKVVLGALDSDHAPFAEMLRSDARAMERLRQALG